MRNLPYVAPLIFLVVLTAQAQRGGFVVPPFGAGPVTGGPLGATVTIGSGHFFRGGLGRRFFPGEIFLEDGFWAGDYSYEKAPSPSVIFVQAAPAAPSTPAVAEESRHAAPALLIEWQGDRYVRYSAASMKPGQDRQLDYVQPMAPARAASTPRSAQARETLHAPAAASAVIVFRGGRQQEVSSYAIIGGMMYVGSDYWTSGAWQQKIQLAELDLPATFRLNRDRGVKFILPSGPNEVVTRP